jgi:hypothetical protein
MLRLSTIKLESARALDYEIDSWEVALGRDSASIYEKLTISWPTTIHLVIRSF